MHSKYVALHKYVIRVPLVSFEEVKQLKVVAIKSLFSQTLIQEAIFSASPDFYKETKKWLRGESVRNEEAIIFSLLKYFLRMGTRATPFGFFSGLAVGSLSENTEIKLNKPELHKSITRLDMDFLCGLSQHIENKKEIRSFLTYYSNSSIYSIEEEFRYIEYYFNGTLKRHFTSSIDFSDFLDSLLEKTKQGLTIEELALLIVEREVSYKAAVDFVHELIDNQILVSSIAPSVSGKDYLELLIEELGELKEINSELIEFDKALNIINQKPLGHKISKFSSLFDIADKTAISYRPNHLLQTDLILSFEHNQISKSLIYRADQALKVLMKLSYYEEPQELKKFKKDFYTKYEEEEIPLALALDIESGIGFGIYAQHLSDISPLIDDINWAYRTSSTSRTRTKLDLFARDFMLHKKLVNAINSGDSVIKLEDNDLINLESNWKRYPDTFSMFINILNEEKAPYLNIEGVGGENAATTLGRFCHADKELNEYVHEIIQAEEKLNENAIVAEIVHLPENRTGNILHRPHLRKYEIPYLSFSSKPIEKQIRIDDLMVSIKEDRIVLRSKSLNKEIIPKLTTAHNYEFNSLPLYHFLSQMQLHKRNGDLSFSWGSLYHLFDFFPRVMYKGVIISRAEWTVKKTDIKWLTTHGNIEEFREKFKLPTVFVLAEADNELLIDTNHKLSVNMFLNEVKNKNNILLKEFLFKEGISPVVNEQGKRFVNEVVLSYIKAQ